jgi:hypothetical protein
MEKQTAKELVKEGFVVAFFLRKEDWEDLTAEKRCDVVDNSFASRMCRQVEISETARSVIFLVR